MLNAVPVFTPLKAHEQRRGHLYCSPSIKGASESKLTRMCGKTFPQCWTFLTISWSSSFTAYLCSKHSPDVKIKEWRCRQTFTFACSKHIHLSGWIQHCLLNPFLMCCFVFLWHLSSLCCEYHRAEPDTSVHTVCCIITQEGSTFLKCNSLLALVSTKL